MKTLKYIFPSTGHCGSRYVARLMSSAGVPCGHEKVFRAGVHSHYVEHDIFEADSSAFAPPFLNHPIAENAQIVQIVRHPLMVMRSWMHGTGQWGPEARPFFCAALRRFYDWDFPVPLESGFNDDRNPDWLACFYIAWNRLIEQQSIRNFQRFHIERGPELLGALNLQQPENVYDDRKCNKHAKEGTSVSGFEIVSNSKIREALEGICLEYGYPLDPREIDEGLQTV